jgi:hypothetical protein
MEGASIGDQIVISRTIVHDSTTPTSFTTRRLVVGVSTSSRGITVTPQGWDQDDWQITVIDSRPTMEFLFLATKPGCRPQLSRRAYGSRFTSNWDAKLAELPRAGNDAWVRRVVRIAKGLAYAHGLEAA